MNVSRETFIVAFLYRNERRVESTWSFQLASASGKTKMPGDLLKALPKSSNSPEGSNSSLFGSNASHRPFKVFQRLVQRLRQPCPPTRLSSASIKENCSRIYMVEPDVGRVNMVITAGFRVGKNVECPAIC